MNEERLILLKKIREENRPTPVFPEELPITAHIDELSQAILNNQVVVIAGETGSGKTTQIPKICLALGRGIDGLIGHTQPRRVAARAVASRLAEELGTQIGQGVGYQIRFSDHVTPTSYIKVMTDGILLAEIQADRYLRQYDTIIIDEAHERSLNIDFLLGYLKTLLAIRKDLKLIITSATLNPQKFANYFGGCPIFEVSGRTYPIEIRYRPKELGDEPSEQEDVNEILNAVDELCSLGDGDILIFLTGEREIRETAEALRKHHPSHTEILPLFARLSIAEQNRVFQTHTGRRIILATNVAETSLTVPGIRFVIDPGFARIKRYSYRSKIQRLPIETISQASANQRAGRCGRVRAGTCIRLYSREDFEIRPEFTEPEILRSNLAAVILQMTALHLTDIEKFPFIDPPDSRLVRDGYKLLEELGAIDSNRVLTKIGRYLIRLPVDPRIGRMIYQAQKEGCLFYVLIIASALCIQDPRERPLEWQQEADTKHRLFAHPKSDFYSYLNLWREFHHQQKHLSNNKFRQYCRNHFLSHSRLREWQDIFNQLLTSIKQTGSKQVHSEILLDDETLTKNFESIHRSLLSGLLSNIGFKSENQEYCGARNNKFYLSPGSGMFKKGSRWIMAMELTETRRVYARNVASIEPEWIEAQAKHLIKKTYSEPHWEKRRSHVVASEKSTLYGLVVNPKRKVNFGPIDPVLSREIFIRSALVEADFETRAPFLKHNLDLIAALQNLEDKARRRNIIVDEQMIFEFYNAHIPEGIYSGPLFEKWYQEAQKNDKKLLFLQENDLIREDAPIISGVQFPEEILIKGMKLKLTYHFEPGSEEDGVTLIVPLQVLNQLSPEPFEWLVPGLLREKIIALIKALPKSLRRNFSPAPNFADACMNRLGNLNIEQSLTAVLTQQLHQITGIEIPEHAWDTKQIDCHLQMNFHVVDKENKIIASGRDLLQIRDQLSGKIKQEINQLNANDFVKQGITVWDFGKLPEVVEITQQNMTIKAYPALVDEGNSVSLSLFEEPQEAHKATQAGLRRLYALSNAKSLQYLRKNIPKLNTMLLHYTKIGTKEDLIDDLLMATLDQNFGILEANVRDSEGFKKILQEKSGELILMGQKISNIVAEILELYHQVQLQLKNQDKLLMEDCQFQLEHLVYKKFIAETPYSWLQRIPYYLKAVLIRIKKFPEAPAKDQNYALELKMLWDRYENKIREKSNSERIHFRWMLEEYRLSLFAQELKTLFPISRQRLDKYWHQFF